MQETYGTQWRQTHMYLEPQKEREEGGRSGILREGGWKFQLTETQVTWIKSTMYPKQVK